METNEGVPSADEGAPGPAPFAWGSVAVIALAAVLALGLFVTVFLHWPGGGKYPLLGRDHDDLMVTDAPNAGRTLTVMFVGNSLTFVNDLPAMLVDIASSDPGAATGLQVKAETYPDATLDQLRTQTGAPDVWGPDRHHPSVAGTYLAALVFYRQFTGRSGAEATWRPGGLSAEDAAKLQRIAAG